VVVTRNPSEAEELTQEAFVRAWQRWDRVSQSADPGAYVRKIAFNAHLSALRRAGRVTERYLRREPERDVAELVEARDTVEAALLELPTRQRTALVLVDGLGYTSDAAAEIMGVRSGTVRRLASLGRTRVHESIKGRSE
jgi:RNA polymerase sigma-70 factor (ECF subfamily)